MDTKTRNKISLFVSKYLRTYSNARKILLVDDINKDFSLVFKSINKKEVVSNKKYLLYRCENENKIAFISNNKKILTKDKVKRRQHVPTFVYQKSFYSNLEEEKEDLLITDIAKAYIDIEEYYINKLIQIAFILNPNKKADTITTSSLKNGLEIANDILFKRVKLINALAKSNDLLINRITPNLKYNVLINHDLLNSDIATKIKIKNDDKYYENNHMLVSSIINKKTAYVMPTAEHLGVMPIINDVSLNLDKNSVISFYEIGLAVLYPENIIKIELI